MGNLQYRFLTDIDKTGFGVLSEQDLDAFTPPHWHEAVELVFFLRGEGVCTLGSSTLSCRPGDLRLANSYELHTTHFSPDAAFLVVHILPEAMCHFVPAFDQLRFSLGPEGEKAQALEALKEQLRQIRQLTEEPSSPLARQARLYDLASLLVRHFSQPIGKGAAQRSDRSRLERVLEYIQLHHGEDISLEETAQSVGLNKAYFCRLFKKNMGVSFLRYIYQVRTTAFCQDLEHTDDPIGEIAERHGFRDAKMLGQYFREIYGCTPSEKRRQFQGTEIPLEICHKV